MIGLLGLHAHLATAVMGCNPSCCAVAGGKLPTYGGQAVIEGVMMRGQRYMAVAVRSPDNEIVLRSEQLPPRLSQGRLTRIPFVRGSIVLWETLVIGMRALMFSADVAVGEAEARLSRPVAWSSVAIGIGLGVGLFFVLPAVLTAFVHARAENAILSNLLEGVVRLVLLIGYVGGIGLFPDIRRVYMYHGAEHKAINSLENARSLQIGDIMRFSIRHPRCGTNFLLIVGVLAIAALAPLGRPDSWLLLLGSRILVIPIVAGVAYEVIRWGAQHIDDPLVKAIMKPGIALQTLTTREPDEAQGLVAASALREVLRLERPDVLAQAEMGTATAAS
jgi:uncharacterized protein YqhQ